MYDALLPITKIVEAPINTHIKPAISKNILLKPTFDLQSTLEQFVDTIEPPKLISTGILATNLKNGLVEIPPIPVTTLAFPHNVLLANIAHESHVSIPSLTMAYHQPFHMDAPLLQTQSIDELETAHATRISKRYPKEGWSLFD